VRAVNVFVATVIFEEIFVYDNDFGKDGSQENVLILIPGCFWRDLVYDLCKAVRMEMWDNGTGEVGKVLCTERLCFRVELADTVGIDLCNDRQNEE
jgi:hypothetical protein